MSAVPGSYLKADPSAFGPNVQLAIYIAGEAENDEAASAIAQRAKDPLRDGLTALGYTLVFEA